MDASFGALGPDPAWLEVSFEKFNSLAAVEPTAGVTVALTMSALAIIFIIFLDSRSKDIIFSKRFPKTK